MRLSYGVWKHDIRYLNNILRRDPCPEVAVKIFWDKCKRSSITVKLFSGTLFTVATKTKKNSSSVLIHQRHDWIRPFCGIYGLILALLLYYLTPLRLFTLERIFFLISTPWFSLLDSTVKIKIKIKYVQGKNTILENLWLSYLSTTS